MGFSSGKGHGWKERIETRRMVLFAGEKDLLKSIKGDSREETLEIPRTHRELKILKLSRTLLKFMIKVRDSAENALEIIANLSYSRAR